jgi:HAD superfamily phosphoserine phosphatase-like hydrolase
MAGKVAFVDICGTLYDSNTTLDFLTLSNKSFASLRKNIFVRLLNKMSRIMIGYDFIRNIGVGKLAGKTHTELSNEAFLFYNSFLSSREIKETHAIIANLRKEGFKIILISATMDFLAKEIGNRVSADSVFSTSLIYEGEICTGKIENDLLGRKHLLAKQMLAEDKMENGGGTEIVVITDDKTDIELALLAQKSFVIIKDQQPFWQSRLGNKVQFIKKSIS